MNDSIVVSVHGVDDQSKVVRGCLWVYDRELGVDLVVVLGGCYERYLGV